MTSLDESAQLAITVPQPRAASLAAALRRNARSIPWGICLITAAAAALRFAQIEGVTANQFYDAAVRSMTLSWHNFFFGAFDPGAHLSIDKPPLDLWLQVVSVKLLGWNATALKLPEALGGTLAVPLLYDSVRRILGRPAALAAAAALAVLPESVLTSRSDTMDSLMMLFVIAALWFTIRAIQTERRRPLILAGVMLGLGFNVKLNEALIGAPALAALWAFGTTMPWRRKLEDGLFAALAFVGVALSWAILASLAPGHHPWPIGSTNGSVWNAMFVFNGVGRAGAAPLGQTGGPGLLRLFQSSKWLYDVLIGSILIPVLAIGGAALLQALRRRLTLGPADDLRLPRAFALSLCVWIGAGLVVFDSVTVLHSRYLEAVAPAFAAAIGFGAAALSGLAEWRGRPSLPSIAAIAAALACVSAYTFSFKPVSIAHGAVALSIGALGAALFARAPGRAGTVGRWLTLGLVVATAVTFPVHESVKLVTTKASNSTGLSIQSDAVQTALSRYLGPRTHGLKYELAVDDPLPIAPLMIHDERAVLPLTSWKGRPLISLAALQAAVRSGQVRYGLVGDYHCGYATRGWSNCQQTALWIRQHGVDVTSEVGMPPKSYQKLYRLQPS